jgi:hypothetical protein
MRAHRILAVVGAVLGTATLAVAQLVSVPGSTAQYPAVVECSVAARPVKMVLTGAALRQKLFVNVYAVGSYVQEGVRVRSAEELAAVNCPKRLHLIMQRAVDGKDLAEAFRAAIRLNYPEPAFAAEITTLSQFLRSTAAQKGDHILLTHVPGVGLQCSLAGKADFLIKNPAFARAVWDIYLGKNNLGESIKKGLVARLAP